jgi:hypothetical protein
MDVLLKGFKVNFQTEIECWIGCQLQDSSTAATHLQGPMFNSQPGHGHPEYCFLWLSFKHVGKRQDSASN